MRVLGISLSHKVMIKLQGLSHILTTQVYASKTSGEHREISVGAQREQDKLVLPFRGPITLRTLRSLVQAYFTLRRDWLAYFHQ